MWVAGFDVIYALQDVQVDRRDGIHSIPAKLGSANALLLAKGVHLVALMMLLLAYRSEAMLGTLFFVGVVIVGLLMVIEHRAASVGRFSMAFFTLNGVISLLLGVLGIVDVISDV
nr:hypothetical protein [uncultured bacterium]